MTMHVLQLTRNPSIRKGNMKRETMLVAITGSILQRIY